MVAEIPSRELRNDTAGVLRRVAAGQELRVLVRGRPVATLSPIEDRPPSLPWPVFAAAIERIGADEELLADLAAEFPETTDDAGR